jgi:hypothetical protein
MPVWVLGDETRDDELDLAWIRQRIPEFQAAIRCHVEDISNTTRKGKTARDGATLLLTLTLPDGGGYGEVTKTAVIKQVPPGGLSLSRQLGLAREARFYSDLAPRVGLAVGSTTSNSSGRYTTDNNDHDDDDASPFTPPSMPQIIPKVYYSYGNMEDGSKVIIMEHLGGDYIDSGILFGPGNPNNWTRDLPAMMALAFPPLSSGNPVQAPTPFEVANQTFLAIAHVHATFWRDPELLQDCFKWLRGSSWVQGMDEASWMASQGLIQGMWRTLLDSGNVDTRIQWDPLVRESLGRAMDGISWEAQVQRVNTGKSSHWTLVHGDFWPGNVMVSATDVHDLRLLDWEMTGLGSGPQDLGQYVLSNMDPTERRGCERSLVGNYYNELIRLGVQDLTWDDCWKEYTIGGVERWLWFLVYFCAQDGPLLDWAQFFHDQIKEFMHDHKIKPDDITQPRP